jgi:transposase
LIRFHADGNIDWSLFSVDGTIVSTHKASAGALTKKTSQANRRTTPSASRKAVRTTKCVVVCDNHLLPLTTWVCGGQASDNPLVLTAMDQIAIRTPTGRIRKRPEKVAGDKGCSPKNNRDGLRKRGITPVIAYKSNEHGVSRPFDAETYKKRNAVERFWGHGKECRRVATR